MAIKRIGIITSGGDAGGLNAVIKGVACVAHEIRRAGHQWRR